MQLSATQGLQGRSCRGNARYVTFDAVYIWIWRYESTLRRERPRGLRQLNRRAALPPVPPCYCLPRTPNNVESFFVSVCFLLGDTLLCSCMEWLDCRVACG